MHIHEVIILLLDDSKNIIIRTSPSFFCLFESFHLADLDLMQLINLMSGI